MAAPGTSSVPAPTAGNAEKLEIAKRLALRINAQKNLGIESQVLSNLFRAIAAVAVKIQKWKESFSFLKSRVSHSLGWPCILWVATGDCELLILLSTSYTPSLQVSCVKVCFRHCFLFCLVVFFVFVFWFFFLRQGFSV